MWERNEIQFPRLLAEIAATVELTRAQMRELAETMDLSVADVRKLFDRAQIEWERIKAQTAD